ncbi:MAG: 1,4-dihydroxy-2-naphthoate octaprenyltransferase [Cytophagaceae bacterium]|nr:1,4-dihydroxy-2-naphthoate octaprenyltransferase [Cytophagaceae bacterium]
MLKLRAWISAARLRTLPLSISGIVTGGALAIETGNFAWDIFILSILATLGFQILSNFANDYGDGVKGTDNHERIGPARAMQSGLLTAGELKRGMVFMALFSLLISFALIYEAFGLEMIMHSILFIVLGLLAIAAAIKYTVGKSAYGYRGLGDVFVFLFFGLLAVCGSDFLYEKTFYAITLLPAVTIGFLSAAVLNLNNMRDRVPDERAGKITLAVKLGYASAKAYHAFLILGAMACALVYLAITGTWLYSVIAITVFIPLLMHLVRVFKNDVPALLDPELKKVALSTFFFSVLFALGFLF